MEILLTILVEFVTIILFEIILDILFEFGFETFGDSRKEQKKTNPIIVLFGYFSLGVVMGFISILFFPRMLVQPSNIPGLSLIATPLVTGLALHTWGDYRQRNGKKTTILATFKGGAIFAFGTALVRFIFFRIG